MRKKKVSSEQLAKLESSGARVKRTGTKKVATPMPVEVKPVAKPATPPSVSTEAVAGMIRDAVRDFAKAMTPPMVIPTAPVKRIVVENITRDRDGFIRDMVMVVERETAH